MKSKSPFAMKSPLLAYKSDQRGNYANPEYVPRIDVGAIVGAHAAKTADDVFSSISQADKAKQKAATDKASSGSNVNNQTVNIYPSGSGSGGESRKSSIDIPEIGDTDITPDPYVHKFKSSPKTGYDKNEKRTVPGEKTLFSSFKDGGEEARLWIANNTEKHKRMLEDKSKNQQRTNTFDANDQIISSTEWQDIKGDTTAMNMKGSPVKHNAGAAGSIGNAGIFGGGIAGISQRISNQAQQRAAKGQQSGSGFFGAIVQAAKSQGGSVVGSIGQQMGNEAQQGAPDAGGSTGADPFLPPPNQVAETGSYGGGGDRDVLEMNSNIINNQSIGRNTDITSQLFGSGQRASMLAMKGTPLHTEGHGGAKGHTHAEPGDNLDQTVAENMDVFDIENYNPIQKFKGRQIVVNPQSKDTIFSQGKDFVIPEQMKGIKRSSEGTPKYKPVYINRNKKQ